MWRSLLVQGDEGRGGSRRVCCSLQRGARPQACLYRARTGEERSQTQPGATAQTARIIWVLGSVADTEDPQPRKIHATVLAIRRPSEGDRRGAECCSVASCTLRQKQWSGRGRHAILVGRDDMSPTLLMRRRVPVCIHVCLLSYPSASASLFLLGDRLQLTTLGQWGLGGESRV